MSKSTETNNWYERRDAVLFEISKAAEHLAKFGQTVTGAETIKALAEFFSAPAVTMALGANPYPNPK